MSDQRLEAGQRPSPEALLEAARREEGRIGKLKIFLGAAPGVGKTYEMLLEARSRLKKARTSSSAWSKLMAAKRLKRCWKTLKSFHAVHPI